MELLRPRLCRPFKTMEKNLPVFIPSSMENHERGFTCEKITDYWVNTGLEGGCCSRQSVKILVPF